MIKLLGFKRTLILGVLLGVNALLAVIYLMWASPQTEALNSQLMGLRSEISNLQTGIQNTKSDMQMLEENLPTYDALIKNGFMQEQDRFVMSRALEDIKIKSHVTGFSFSVGDIREIANADAQLAGKRLLHSRISITNISSPLDINVYDMIRLIETEYPVHARIHGFKISRSGALTEEAITNLASQPVSLISAELTFDWFSLSNIPQDANAPPGMRGGDVMRASLIFSIVMLALLLVLPCGVYAQEAPVEEEPALEIRNYDPRDYLPLGAIAPDGNVQVTDEVVFQSLLFTPEDINTIITALNRRPVRSGANTARGFVGGPLAGTGAQTAEEGESAEARPYYPPIPTKRIISVSGLLYRNPGDWIVWLNGHKLVPGARLPELVDIKVERDRVHLKWFDIGMAKILSITLRPRQTYDITSGVMLTTTGGDMQ